MLIACSRMYNVNAAANAAWRAVFQHVCAAANVPLAVIDHAAPAPLETLWSRPDIGAVFMCGWPFSRADPQPRLVAAPVPVDARFGQEPAYASDFVVAADSRYRCLADTFGGRLSWTVRGSHSGFNAPRYHLLAYRTPDRPRLYAEAVGPVLNPRGAIDAVLAGRADVAPVDSYALELIRAFEPDLAERLRVIDTTAPAPIPPLVASPDAAPAQIDLLAQVFCDLANHTVGRALLAAVRLRRFTRPPAGSYAILDARAKTAHAAGYDAPA